MSTYANQTNIENYIDGWTTTDPFELEKIIQWSERDVDRILPIIHNEGLPPTIVVSMPGVVSGGTFLPTFNGYAGDPVPFNDNGSVFTTSLEDAILAEAAVSGNFTDGADVTVIGNNPWTIIWGLNFVLNNYGYSLVVPPVTIDSTDIVPDGIITSQISVMGRKVNPLEDLTSNQIIALANATSAQVEYKVSMGNNFFVKAQFDTVKGPDFATTGKLPHLGPKVLRELTNTGLIMKGGRASAGWGRRGVNRGWANY